MIEARTLSRRVVPSGEATVLIVLSTAVDASNTLHTNAYSSVVDIAEHNDVTETQVVVC